MISAEEANYIATRQEEWVVEYNTHLRNIEKMIRIEAEKGNFSLFIGFFDVPYGYCYKTKHPIEHVKTRLRNDLKSIGYKVKKKESYSPGLLVSWFNV